jgi:hypothetical protein
VFIVHSYGVLPAILQVRLVGLSMEQSRFS